MQIFKRASVFMAGVLCWAAFPPSAQAQEEDDEGPVWIKDDIGKGFAEAKKSGKPLMVVFR